MSEMLKLFHSYPTIRKLYRCDLGMGEHDLHTSSLSQNTSRKAKCLQLHPYIRN